MLNCSNKRETLATFSEVATYPPGCKFEMKLIWIRLIDDCSSIRYEKIVLHH